MPPLNALKAFEAAARHESFAKAAAELGVTPAAVSHQVKALEGWIGTALFARQAQGLYLTEVGRSAMPAFTRAFDALGTAVQELRVAAPRVQINIAALPSVAQLWLAPRLPTLRAAFPALRPSIHALEQPPDFRREPFDLALFFTHETPTGCRSEKLYDDRILPVCTPALAAGLTAPADLLSRHLLWDTSWSEDWPRWLNAAGVPGRSPIEGSSFSLFSLALQAALDGGGVLMGHEALVAAPLASGDLVAPFDLPLATGLTLRVLAPERSPSRVVAILNWLAASG